MHAAVGVQGKIALGVVLGVGHQHQVRQHAVGVQLRRARQQAGKWVVGVDVAIHHHERPFTQQGQRGGDAAGGFQRAGLGGIRQLHAPGGAVAQPGFDLRAQVGVVDHHPAHASGGQPAQMPANQRLGAHLQQGFGRGVGQRAHALAASGGQHHGRAGGRGHQKV